MHDAERFVQDPSRSEEGPLSSNGAAGAESTRGERIVRTDSASPVPSSTHRERRAPDAEIAEERAHLDALERLVREQLQILGEDPEREGLVRTPARVARSLRFLTSGYEQDVREILNSAVFEEPYDEMVIVKDIDFYSLCEHHMLPFYGKAHVAYIPKGKIIGLSKIPRIVDVFARRLQVQERLTQQIAGCIQDAIRPLGVAVVIEGLHLCMAMRGVEKQNSFTATSAMLGVFRHDRGTRAEFMNLIQRRS